MGLGHLELLELAVLLLATPPLVVGYLRTRRLQPYLRSPGLQALGRFFLLYAIASVARFGFTAVAIAAGEPTSLLADAATAPGQGGPLAFHHVATHGLVVVALGSIAFQYLRGARGLAGGWLAVAAVAFPLVEAALALVPAAMTLANQRGRHTRRSKHIALGFGLIALGHLLLAFLSSVSTVPAAFHLVVASQLLALLGAVALVVALPRSVG